MYFRLTHDPDLQTGYVRKTDNPAETLATGALVDETRLVLPWPHIVVMDEEEGLEMADYYSGPSIMSKRLVETLRQAGADNLQTFPAEITNTTTQEVIRDFVAVNVVGLVSAANDAASTATPVAGKKFFHKLVIDPKRAAGLLVFRLAESLIDIIVEERVAKAVQAGKFRGLGLVPLEESGG
jgi:hypothetical protein